MTRKAKPKARMGRPPRAAKASGARVELRLTAAERTLWLEAASRESLTMSAWLRAAAELAIARGSTR